MSDDRREAADIARAVRRYLERERAAGGADLLADGATRAARSPLLGERSTGDPAGPGRSGVAGDRAPAGTGGGTNPGDPQARVARMAERAGDQTEAAPGRRRPSVLPESSLRPVPPEPSTAITNLFGEPEPAPASMGPATSLLDEPAIAVFAEGLNPGGLGARADLADEALPVLARIADEVCACTKCGLCETRTQAVPGVGTARGGIVFVGEAPGADEDRLGEPFVGRAGQLLDRIIKAMNDARLIPGLPLDRSTVYICNVLKCRPPENRNPLPHEIESCSPFLRRQLEALRPRIICCLGKFAAELLVGAKGTIRDLRGKVYRYQGAKLIVTYHPAACLRSASYKRPVWEDMQLLAREYLSD